MDWKLVATIVASVIGIIKFGLWLKERSIKQSISDFNQFQEIFYNSEMLGNLEKQSVIVRDLACKTIALTKNLTFNEVLLILNSNLNVEQLQQINSAKKQGLAFNVEESRYFFKESMISPKLKRLLAVAGFTVYVFILLAVCFYLKIDFFSTQYIFVLFFLGIVEFPWLMQRENIKAVEEIQNNPSDYQQLFSKPTEDMAWISAIQEQTNEHVQQEILP